MSSGPQRQEDSNHRPADSAPGKANVRQSSDNVLDSVLAQSGGSSEGTGFLAPGQMEAAREAARKFRGQPFTLEPVLVEFIHASFAVQFRDVGMSVDTIRAMARAAAKAFFDDEVSRARVEALWLMLAES